MRNGNAVNPERRGLALYYLRLGVGFFTLWSAWDVTANATAWNALYTFFPFTNLFSEVMVAATFLLYAATGLALLTGWNFRAAAALLAFMLFLSTGVLQFWLPGITTVLGPFRAGAAFDLIWLGACLVLLTHETDPHNPERRSTEAREAWAPRMHLVFRLLFAAALLWDAGLRMANAHDYALVLGDAAARMPWCAEACSRAVVSTLTGLEVFGGVVILLGPGFRAGLAAAVLAGAFMLLILNWFMGMELLHAGGRFVMRHVLVLAAVAYFWLRGAGPGALNVRIGTRHD